MAGTNPFFNDSETSGFWKTETESARIFDELVDNLGGLFRVYKEVEGRYQTLRLTQRSRDARIDRILVPTSQLRAAGWTLGPVGVELKRSGEKLGPPLCQLIDYTHAAWRLNDAWVVPEWYFLWPAGKFTGPLQSILAGQRCGGVYRDTYGRLTFHSAFILAKLSADQPDCRPENTLFGTKVGSR